MAQAALRAVVIAGPSGSGKSTLIGRLLAQFPNSFGFSVSHTSRSARPGERDGVSYYFSNKQDMEAMRDRGEFIETAIYSGNMYGTSKRALDDVISAGKVPLLDIDLQGVRSVKAAGIPAKYIFIEPPSVEELTKRLTLRGEAPESIERRINTAMIELRAAKDEEHLWDAIVVNQDLELAYELFRQQVLTANERDYS